MSDVKRTVLDAFRRRQHDLVDLCAKLVRIPSENPPGDTTRIAEVVDAYLGKRGIPTKVYEPRKRMPNVVGTIGTGRRTLVLASHLDEFPAGGGWTVPPFSGLIKRGRVIGRGVGDMRAGIAVSLFAAGLLCELDVDLSGRLTLAFASDEETGGVWGTQWLLKNVPAVRGDACLIGESSGTWSVGIGEKGVLWLRLKASGVSGHAAYAQGESAVGKILEAVQVIQSITGVKGQAPAEVARVIRAQRPAAEGRWGPGTGKLADRLSVNVGTIRGGGQVNLIPAAAEAEVDFRLPPGLATTALLSRLSGALRAKHLGSVTVEVLNQCESYVTSPGERIVRATVENAQRLCGLRALPVVRLGYTDGRFFRRAGIPTVVYGPRVQGMGGPDESIEIRDLLQVATVHLGVIVDVLGVQG